MTLGLIFIVFFLGGGFWNFDWAGGGFYGFFQNPRTLRPLFQNPRPTASEKDLCRRFWQSGRCRFKQFSNFFLLVFFFILFFFIFVYYYYLEYFGVLWSHVLQPILLFEKIWCVIILLEGVNMGVYTWSLLNLFS